jgi:Flp pilus assembly protein TadG
MMALLALVVFGLIGILLTVAVILEQSKLKRKAKGDAARSVASEGTPSLNPKLR